MIKEMLILLVIIAILTQIVAVGSSLMIIKKFESFMQRLCIKSIFDINNFYAHRLWFSLLSIVVSFGYINLAAEQFIKLTGAFKGLVVLKYVLMNIAVGILILQYNFFILRDRRNIK